MEPPFVQIPEIAPVGYYHPFGVEPLPIMHDHARRGLADEMANRHAYAETPDSLEVHQHDELMKSGEALQAASETLKPPKGWVLVLTVDELVHNVRIERIVNESQPNTQTVIGKATVDVATAFRTDSSTQVVFLADNIEAIATNASNNGFEGSDHHPLAAHVPVFGVEYVYGYRLTLGNLAETELPQLILYEHNLTGASLGRMKTDDAIARIDTGDFRLLGAKRREIPKIKEYLDLRKKTASDEEAA